MALGSLSRLPGRVAEGAIGRSRKPAAVVRDPRKRGREVPPRAKSGRHCFMIRAAIVGLGRWGRNHVSAVAGSSRIRYVRGVTRNPALARDFAAQHRLALSCDLA
jgi:hypothetical protein